MRCVTLSKPMPLHAASTAALTQGDCSHGGSIQLIRCPRDVCRTGTAACDLIALGCAATGNGFRERRLSLYEAQQVALGTEFRAFRIHDGRLRE